MFSTSSKVASLALLVGCVSAVVLPTAPVAGDIFDTGKPCPIRWNPDNTDQWTNFTVDLMTGSNKGMVFVTNVATQLDGTIGSPVPYAWSCPDVDEHSAVWFYAFSNNVNGTSTGAIYSPRFTIASASGEAGPAPHATQPDGQPTPWGYGSIIDHTPSPGSPSAAPKVAARGGPPKVPEMFLPFARPVTPPNSKHGKQCKSRYCRYYVTSFNN